MRKSYSQIIEEHRLAEMTAKIAAQRAARLAAPPPSRRRRTADSRPWIGDVRDCIVRNGKYRFTLAELYCYVRELEALHPNNAFAEEHIRHTLQQLRDLGEVTFVSPGEYLYLPFERPQL